jgi:gas vesicle protein
MGNWIYRALCRGDHSYLSFYIMASKKLLLGVLAGVATGIMLGILFAPDMGWNTRKRIVKKGDDYADAFLEKIEEFLYAISDDIDEGKDEIDNFSEKSKVKTAEL